jgi:ATP-dependent Clp protease, protease subunit
MSDSLQNAPSTPPSEIYAVFCGNIDQAALQKIFTGLAGAMAQQIAHVHLLFQSSGGFVSDGICLHNLFKALTLDLTIYNAGAVQSVALIAYLGAKRRKTSSRALFMMHRTTSGAQPTTASKLKGLAKSLTLDDARTEEILRDYIKLPDDDWSSLDNQDVFFSGEEAVKTGIAHEIGEFSPPPGTQIFNV